MKSGSEVLQEIVRKYQAAGNSLPAAPREIARWAIANGLWRPKPEAVVDQCADQIARAMAVEYFTDSHGRRVRAKHAVVKSDDSVQHVLWDDIRTGSYEHMHISLQQRRKLIVNDCGQLKNDVDYFNENRAPDRPINMVFDFTLDLEERELARKKTG